jgi:hypothetical protein
MAEIFSLRTRSCFCEFASEVFRFFGQGGESDVETLGGGMQQLVVKGYKFAKRGVGNNTRAVGNEQSSDLLGPRASRPQMSARRENEFGA